MKKGDLIHHRSYLGVLEIVGIALVLRDADGYQMHVDANDNDITNPSQANLTSFWQHRARVAEAERDAALKSCAELREKALHPIYVGSPAGRVARPEHLAAQDGHNAQLSAAAIRHGSRRDSPATAAADDVTRANPVEPGEARMETATEPAKGSPDHIISSNPQFVEDWHNDRLSRLEERAAAEGFGLVIEGEAGEGPAPADATPSIRVTHQRVMPGVCAVTMEASGELPPGDYVLANRLEH